MARTKGALGKAPKKPRKSRKTAEASQPESQPTSSQSSGAAEFKKPSPDALQKLVKQVCSRAADQKSLGMESKELIDKAAETQGLNKKAFGIVKALWKMGQDAPEKLAITLPHLLAYIDDLKLPEIADQNRGLPINGENDGQVDLEEAIAETTGAETGDFYDSAANSAPAHRLTIVPGPNAPDPDGDEAAA
jgi:hypothetical protein